MSWAGARRSQKQHPEAAAYESGASARPDILSGVQPAVPLFALPLGGTPRYLPAARNGGGIFLRPRHDNPMTAYVAENNDTPIACEVQTLSGA